MCVCVRVCVCGGILFCFKVYSFWECVHLKVYVCVFRYIVCVWGGGGGGGGLKWRAIVFLKV